MFRKTPEALAHWSPDTVAACASRQSELLPQAARLVLPGGRLVYSTCTLGPEENEAVIGKFLDRNREWEAVAVPLPAVDAGRPEWAPGERAHELRLSARLWPHKQAGEGHFVALLSRLGSDPVEAPGAHTGESKDQRSRERTSAGESRGLGQATMLWRRFVSETLAADPLPEHRLLLQRDGLYAVPPGSPDLGRVKTLRPGLWLGSVARERFIPSHSLALALRSADALDTVALQPDDAELDAYLAGSELDVPGAGGWTLVTVAGHPLGWGRRARDIVKNHYPKGLRRSG